MSIRSGIAKTVSGILTWGLRSIARRPAGNLPGKVALKIDPYVVRELRGKLRKGSVVVVGTNGKTTVTNLMADVLEQTGQSVLCNRTGANLKSGIASALLQNKPADWGVIECDELWLAKVLPDLRASYVLLLDLFRDQLDRCGEIDRIQESIIGALASSPATGLIYNADDPLCAYVAKRVVEEDAAKCVGNTASEMASAACASARRVISFGVAESMQLAQNVVVDATMCQVCSHMFAYDYRQYGQLGAYSCAHCGFARPALDFAAKNVNLAPSGLNFEAVNNRSAADEGDPDEGASAPMRLSTRMAGTYMVYNLLAVYACGSTVGCSGEALQRAIAAFNPKNGRLQEYCIDGRRTLLNLAKNPTGFNQNLRIVAGDVGPQAVAFFINDQVEDGHDISWIWDIDFEELANTHDAMVFAGGTRKHDLQVRLKYAGINAELIDGIDDVFNAASAMTQEGRLPACAPVYAIANYSALPPVHAKLDALQASAGEAQHDCAKADAAVALQRGDHGEDCAEAPNDGMAHAESASAFSSGGDAAVAQTPVVIAHVLPDLLNLYGDGGNVRILEQRLAWRGIPVEVRRIRFGEPLEFADADLVFLGGGPDREQKLAAEQLMAARDDLADYIADGGPVLAICGGYQILGRTWLLGDEEVPGLSILGIETRRPGTSADRLIGNVALRSPIAHAPVIGFENHAGRTYLDQTAEPFGTVVSHTGSGNNDEGPRDKRADGVLSGNILGTYLHGTLLAKNPEVADWLLERALARHAARTNEPKRALSKLDDSVELNANAVMAKKLM